MKKLLVILFMLAAMNASALDTITCKYFPLAVGNVYKYYWGTSVGYSNTYKIRIVKDTIIENKKYFIFSPGIFGSNSPVRFDTLTGNIYSRSAYGYCTYSAFEILQDSLKAYLNDTSTVCYSVHKHRCSFIGYWNILNNYVPTKRFRWIEYPPGDYEEYVYAMGFGLVSINLKSGNDYASHSLMGCYVNGVLYGDTILTEIKQISTEVSSSYSLGQNYPNPFNAGTVIRFDVMRSPTGTFGDDNALVVLKVFDVTGREVQTLVNERMQAGTYEVSFDARQGGSSSGLNSGVYFYQMRVRDFRETRRMILLK